VFFLELLIFGKTSDPIIPKHRKPGYPGRREKNKPFPFSSTAGMRFDGRISCQPAVITSIYSSSWVGVGQGLGME
jgi:hypothetical protein